MMSESWAFAIAYIALVSFAAQWAAWRARLPAILLLLLVGILSGSVLGVLKPDQLFGELLFPFVSASVAIILFEGALTLNLDEIRKTASVVRRLVSIGALAGGCIVTAATHYILDFSWGFAVLIGAITTVTGPTVISPLLRTVRPNANIANVLRWEGILIDPVGAILTLLVFEFILTRSHGGAVMHTLQVFAELVATGVVLGGGAGAALGILLKRHLVPEYLRNFAVLSVVLVAFTLSNYIIHESGLLTVTIAGLILANIPGVQIRDILHFKENLSLLLISGLFIILAARISLEDISSLGFSVLVLLLVMQFVARPVGVLLSTWGSSLTWKERIMVSWVAPRGIVAAAVAAIFALRMEQAGEAESVYLVPLVFSIIIGTVVFQSITARLVAAWLGVAEPSPKGFLIIGANAFARMIAKSLQDEDIQVLLVDTSRENIVDAKMEGLKAFYGNPVSEYADQHLDLVGLGRMLALTPERHLNAVSSMRYQSEFGQDRVYSILVSDKKLVAEKLRASEQHRGQTLFGKDVSYGKLASLISKGGVIKSTKITADFDFSEYKNTHPNAILLFAKKPSGWLEVFKEDSKLTPEEGWTILSLVPASA
ncbi:MAG: sodium:proton antiporter [Pseudomonadales bacterium]